MPDWLNVLIYVIGLIVSYIVAAIQSDGKAVYNSYCIGFFVGVF